MRKRLTQIRGSCLAGVEGTAIVNRATVATRLEVLHFACSAWCCRRWRRRRL